LAGNGQGLETSSSLSLPRLERRVDGENQRRPRLSTRTPFCVFGILCSRKMLESTSFHWTHAFKSNCKEERSVWSVGWRCHPHLHCGRCRQRRCARQRRRGLRWLNGRLPWWQQPSPDYAWLREQFLGQGPGLHRGQV